MAIKIDGSNFPTKASDQFKPSKAGYGQGGFGGASSDVPGERTRAVLSVNNDDSDAALAQVRAQGGEPPALTHEQLRTVAGSRPTTFGMKPSTPADTPKVPGTLDNHSDVYAKPRR